MLVRLRVPSLGAEAVDRREEVLVRGVGVDVLALHGYLVTRHVIRGHDE